MFAVASRPSRPEREHGVVRQHHPVFSSLVPLEAGVR